MDSSRSRWQRPLSRAGFLAAVAAGGYFAADAVSEGSTVRRICSTLTRTITVTEPPPPPPVPPPPPGPVPLGGSLYTRLPESSGSVTALSTSQQIADFLVNANDGDIGEIAAGTYAAPVGSSNGRYTLSGNSGAAGNPITLRAAAGATVILRPTVTAPHEVLTITGGAQYWRFKGIIFEEAGTGSNYQNAYVATCSDIEFQNCEFREANEGTGIFVEEDCPRIHIVNCVSHDNHIVAAQNQAHGYYVTGDNCMLINCIAYNQDGFGFQIRTNDTDGPDSVIVANCLAYNCKPVAAPGNEYAGFMAESKADGCQFWNNITYSNRNGFRGLQAGQVPTTANIARKNIAFANSDASYVNNNLTNWVFDFDGAGDHGPADTNQNIAVGDNLHQDPLLVNPAAFDFHLQAGSPAIGYGNQDYCPTFDFDNNPRSGCDAGPYRASLAAGSTRKRPQDSDLHSF